MWHCKNLTRPEPRSPAAWLSACSFADFLHRIDLADFLLETFSGFLAITLRVLYRIFFSYLNITNLPISDCWHRGESSEVADLGHGGPGEVSRLRHTSLLQVDLLNVKLPMVLGRNHLWLLQIQWKIVNLTNKPDFQPFKMAFVRYRIYAGMFYDKLKLPTWSTVYFLWRQSLTRIRIWMRMDPHWFGFLAGSGDPDPHWD